MRQSQFVNGYMSRIEALLDSVLDRFDPKEFRTSKLLSSEINAAETLFLEYRAQYRKEPELDYLQQCVNDFGVLRMSLFNANEREISCEDFESFHIQNLEQQRLLDRSKFETEDYFFIRDRELLKARKFFNEKANQPTGYDRFDIKVSKQTQQMAFELLADQFKADYATFYGGMEVEKTAI